MAEQPALPSVAEQARRLVDLGVADLSGLSAADFLAHAEALTCDDGVERLLVVDPARVPPSELAPLMRLPGHDAAEAKEGFVVVDMSDVDRFGPLPEIAVPDGPLYTVTAPDRGDGYANWSPDEALPEIRAAGRTPLLLHEAITWALQTPQVVAPNHCYMAIGSRLRKADGRLDARTPAVWISGGTGRDGRARKGAPKVGWCWAGNRHTWLGIASAQGRAGRRASSTH